MIVTIHQPNFLHWLPFFEKAAQADLLVLLVHCQYEHGGYQNRFQLDGKWHALKVARRMLSIAATQYAHPQEDWAKIEAALPQHATALRTLRRRVCDSLAVTNTQIICDLFEMLSMKPRVDFDEPTVLTGTARLVEICKRHGATEYLSGPSGKKYLDLAQFEAAGIRVRFFEATDKRHVLEVL